jgi:glycosyltransferase involved in cell wall biosynthesis
MRIAQVAPLAEAVPPKLYGGTERVVSWLTEELVEMGHEVTLFASGDSITDAVLEPCSRRALRLDSGRCDPMLAYGTMLARLAELAGQFDVVHSHIEWVHIPLLNRPGVPFVTTVHGRLDLPDLERCFERCLPRRRSCRFPTRSVHRCRRPIGWGPSITVCRSNC